MDHRENRLRDLAYGVPLLACTIGGLLCFQESMSGQIWGTALLDRYGDPTPSEVFGLTNVGLFMAIFVVCLIAAAALFLLWLRPMRFPLPPGGTRMKRTLTKGADIVRLKDWRKRLRERHDPRDRRLQIA